MTNNKNKMIKHLSPSGSWLMVMTPVDAKDFVIDMGYLIFKIMDMDPKKWTTDAEIERDAVRFLKTGKSKFSKLPDDYSMWITSGLPLPPGNYSIEGLGSELSEEQKKEIVEHIETEYYRNYLHKSGATTSITESFDSLLKHHNLEPKQTLFLKMINE